MKATLTRIVTLRPDVRSFYFRPEQPLHYTPGQFIDLGITHQNVDDRGTSRQYTLSSSPHEPELAITSKFPTGKSSTYKQALLALKPGDAVSVSEAMGDFVLPLDDRLPLVFVAGGIGITPFRSMAAWLSDRGETRDISLHYAVSAKDQEIFMDELSAVTDHTYLHVTGQAGKWLSAADILSKTADTDGSYYYIAGPEAMADSLKRDLRAAGIRPYQIIVDSFLGYA